MAWIRQNQALFCWCTNYLLSLRHSLLSVLHARLSRCTSSLPNSAFAPFMAIQLITVPFFYFFSHESDYHNFVCWSQTPWWILRPRQEPVFSYEENLFFLLSLHLLRLNTLRSLLSSFTFNDCISLLLLYWIGLRLLNLKRAIFSRLHWVWSPSAFSVIRKSFMPTGCTTRTLKHSWRWFDRQRLWSGAGSGIVIRLNLRLRLNNHFEVKYYSWSSSLLLKVSRHFGSNVLDH